MLTQPIVDVTLRLNIRDIPGKWHASDHRFPRIFLGSTPSDLKATPKNPLTPQRLVNG
jgi:hypothetical protein